MRAEKWAFLYKKLGRSYMMNAQVPLKSRESAPEEAKQEIKKQQNGAALFIESLKNKMLKLFSDIQVVLSYHYMTHYTKIRLNIYSPDMNKGQFMPQKVMLAYQEKQES